MVGSPYTLGTTTKPANAGTPPAVQQFFTSNCSTPVTYVFLNEFISNFNNGLNYLGLPILPNDDFALKKMIEAIIGGENNFRTGNIDLKNPNTNTYSALSFLDALGGSRGYLLYNEADDYFRVAKRNDSGTTSYIDMYNDRVEFSDAIKIQGLDPFLKRQDIEPNTNLNDIKIDGYYNQNLNRDTSTDNNYPVAKAGTLTVRNDSDDIIYQTYQTYDSTGIYYRSFYLSTWYKWRKIWDGGNDGEGSGLDADLLDGFHASSFRDVSLSTGTLPKQRLPAIIDSDTTGNAATASNSSLLQGASLASVRNASLLTGVASKSILPAIIDSDTTGNAATASNSSLLQGASLASVRNASLLTGVASKSILPAIIDSDTTGNAATATKLVTPNGTITDFKEGTFTPNINCFSSAVVAEGRYQKIQNVVNLSIYFELNDTNRTGTGSSLIRISNVPYLSSVLTQKSSLLNLYVESGFYAFENQIGAIHAVVDASNNVLNFIYHNEFERSPMTIAQLANWTGVKKIRISGQLFLF
jgi:hypothetical protein